MKVPLSVKRKENGEVGVFAEESFGVGKLVLKLKGDWISEPTKHSIQIGERHLDSAMGGYLNHHCNPNTRVVLQVESLNKEVHYVPLFTRIQGSLTSVTIANPHPVLIATRTIGAGEEITFDYETTETELAAPFKCACHGRWIRGKGE
jgi:hypothetical protein|tara:strand:- start:406 stop:849 length:444 start_codon:yes stop_codon:yes gene_type:complete